ncbi:MAG TPA: patatin-like phospholipase family protein [Bacteroidia bacterium]|nr:patatin-like phospholipase family protein [Bacteroidia bacterium]
MAYNYTNLVFKGGGVLGIAYAGAIKVLEDNGILQQVRRAAGTSAGAITAALVCLKYSAAEILHEVSATNFKSFEDGLDPLRVATKYGLFKGDAFLSWMQQRLIDKGFSATATFTDLKNKGMSDLHVFASDLNTQNLREFSFATTPGVPVAYAVRASMSIPLFFNAWQFPGNNPDNHLYVDGGMVYNYPVRTFDQNGVNPATLGFFLSNLNAPAIADTLDYNHLVQYVRNTFDTIMNAQNINFRNDPSDEKRTVMIDNLGISATNFGLTQQQEQDLYNSGVKYTTAFLQPDQFTTPVA